jgi:hypothetical protein
MCVSDEHEGGREQKGVFQLKMIINRLEGSKVPQNGPQPNIMLHEGLAFKSRLAILLPTNRHVGLSSLDGSLSVDSFK